jgi:Pyridoxamine 5'-phosphate oxidase
MPDSATWAEIASRLTPPRIYWLHTTSPSGAPQATPVWGLVVEDSLYFYTERSTVKARNLVRDQRVLVHLESGADVVIVHGRLVDLGRPADTPEVVDAFDAKYDQPWEKPFLPANDPAFDVLYVLEPARAALWTLPDSAASMRRWASAGEG